MTMEDIGKFALFLQALAADRDLIGIGEEATKHALVLPVLGHLGWETWNIRDVVPEFSMGEGRVDYCLAVDRKPRVFVEVKGVDQSLQDHQKQLLGYAFNRGVELAALTNGFSWWFYLPLLEGSWEEHKFFVIDIHEQAPNIVADHFARFLSRAAVASGEAADEARSVRESNIRQVEITRALPQAWQRLISEPDELLVDLIAEAVERTCGHKPDSDTVAEFITDHLPLRLSTSPVIPPRERRPNDNVPRTRNPVSPSHYRGGYTGTRAKGFTFEGTYHPVSSYIDILLMLSNVLRVKHGGDFDAKALTLHGSKRKYFSREQDLWLPKRLQGEPPLFAEAHLAAGHIVKICDDMLERLGYNQSALSVDFDPK